MSSLADELGWMTGMSRIVSPNCDVRPRNVAPTLVVVHAISLPPGEFGGNGVVELFTNCLDPSVHPYFAQIEGLRVSAHFFIRRSGETIQFVPCAMRAWHAGVSQWRERERCNDFSVGIELEGTDDLPFEDAQYVALNSLLSDLRRIYPIAAVTGHSDIAPGRKTDPGPCFEWNRVDV